MAEVDGERLGETELVSFCMLLLAAGQETTKNLTANAIVCFTQHPDVLERVVREPTLVPTAIEEVLRYLPLVWFLVRQTKTDVELYRYRSGPSLADPWGTVQDQIQAVTWARTLGLVDEEL